MGQPGSGSGMGKERLPEELQDEALSDGTRGFPGAPGRVWQGALEGKLGHVGACA